MSRTNAEPITPSNCNSSRRSHRTQSWAMNETASEYSSEVIPLLASISRRPPTAGLNLNKLPKSQQRQAKRMLQDVWWKSTRAPLAGKIKKLAEDHRPDGRV